MEGNTHLLLNFFLKKTLLPFYAIQKVGWTEQPRQMLEMLEHQQPVTVLIVCRD